MADESNKTQEQQLEEAAIVHYDKQLGKILSELKEGLPDKDLGAPLAISSRMMFDLTVRLKNGMNIEQACRASFLGKTTFYGYYNKSETFRNEIDLAKDFPSVVARTKLVDAMAKGNLVVAMWWLERTEPDEFAKRPSIMIQNNNNLDIVTGKDEEMVAKLMKKYAERRTKTA